MESTASRAGTLAHVLKTTSFTVFRLTVVAVFIIMAVLVLFTVTVAVMAALPFSVLAFVATLLAFLAAFLSRTVLTVISAGIKYGFQSRATGGICGSSSTG